MASASIVLVDTVIIWLPWSKLVNKTPIVIIIGFCDALCCNIGHLQKLDFYIKFLSWYRVYFQF